MESSSATVPTGIHAAVSGAVVMIGFGSVGRGTLPLLVRHIRIDTDRLWVIDPSGRDSDLAESYGATYVTAAVTEDNHRDLLVPYLTAGEGRGLCINLSVDTSSVAIMRLCRELGVLYIDTVVEPWSGFYRDSGADNSERTNHALRRTVIAERDSSPGGTTAVSCCGANPGMVSWFVKEALVRLADDVGHGGPRLEPLDRRGWAQLMRDLGVRGVHIAERDTQRTASPRPVGEFRNTWSVEGFVAEGLQPAELGWGTHERWMPDDARRHGDPDAPGIFLERPGADTRVRTWCPSHGSQLGFLVTHNEALSISDYYTVRDDDGTVLFRPTCHYAYLPADDAVMSWHEVFGDASRHPETMRVIDETEIVGGRDELGVLLYGHERNALWFGSRLTIEEARVLAPHQNATGLQVSSAVLAGAVWAIENPDAGIVEADEMDHARCLRIQRPYLGAVEAHYTDWTPLDGRPGLFPEEIDTDDPWQFRNVLVR